jgi:hypothetical protein
MDPSEKSELAKDDRRTFDESSMPKQGDNQRARVLPHVAICRVRKDTDGELYVCLVKSPQGCRHSIGFDDIFFCLHPERKEIAVRTDWR